MRRSPRGECAVIRCMLLRTCGHQYFRCAAIFHKFRIEDAPLKISVWKTRDTRLVVGRSREVYCALQTFSITSPAPQSRPSLGAKSDFTKYGLGAAKHTMHSQTVLGWVLIVMSILVMVTTVRFWAAGFVGFIAYVAWRSLGGVFFADTVHVSRLYMVIVSASAFAMVILSYRFTSKVPQHAY